MNVGVSRFEEVNSIFGLQVTVVCHKLEQISVQSVVVVSYISEGEDFPRFVTTSGKVRQYWTVHYADGYRPAMSL